MKLNALLLLLVTLALCSVQASRATITLRVEHSGQACTIAELLPACIQMLKCHGRKIVVSTDGCGQPWIIVEQEIFNRLRGIGEPERIERGHFVFMQ